MSGLALTLGPPLQLWLPLPLGEGWGRSGAFEAHAPSPRSDSGLQAGVRTASEGGAQRRYRRSMTTVALTLTLSQREREQEGGLSQGYEVAPSWPMEREQHKAIKATRC